MGCQMDSLDESIVNLALGLTIAKRRKELGLRQQDLADRIGKSRPAVVNMEAGNQRVTVFTLLRLASALDCEPVDLLPKGTENETGFRPTELASHGEDVQNWVNSIIEEGRDG